VKITLESGVAIEATAEHLIHASGEWKRAGEISVGELLVDRAGDSVKVASVSRMVREETVYDLTVANNRNFFVSKAYVLVHNISPCEKAAQALAKAVPKSCLANFQCKEFAREFEKLLLKKEMKGTRLCLRSRTGRIWSDVAGVIATNGIHVSTLVGDLVFDNLNPDGKPRAEWSKDLGVGEFDDLDLKEESIGGPGCIDD